MSSVKLKHLKLDFLSQYQEDHGLTRGRIGLLVRDVCPNKALP